MSADRGGAGQEKMSVYTPLTWEPACGNEMAGSCLKKKKRLRLFKEREQKAKKHLIVSITLGAREIPAC